MGKNIGRIRLLWPKRSVFVGFAFVLFVVVVVTRYNIYLSLQSTDINNSVEALQAQIQLLERQCQLQKIIDSLKTHMKSEGPDTTFDKTERNLAASLSPEVIEFQTKATGIGTSEAVQVNWKPDVNKTHTSLWLLPHLENHADSLRPAYHLQGSRDFADYVIGIPTVKRDKKSYLETTLRSVVNGLNDEEKQMYIIVVMVAETDIDYVLSVAQSIQKSFPKETASGLIEIISPSSHYYPDFNSLPLTLGDSQKRVKWRSKENLDAIYLMSYAKTKCRYYLMLQDDVLAEAGYMQKIREFTDTAEKNSYWFMIDYSKIGCIGKLFKATETVQFIMYVQLFYYNQPIDWLLGAYLTDRSCHKLMSEQECTAAQNKIRPSYKRNLFQHIGLFSSLKGKLQKVSNSQYRNIPDFFPHENPPLKNLTSTIQNDLSYTIENAYTGKSYYLAIKPKKGDTIEFYFLQPSCVARFLFRSGGINTNEKLTDGMVEILPANNNSTFIEAATFDEFGLAEGEVDSKYGPLAAIRIRINNYTQNRLRLTEVEIVNEDCGENKV